MVIPRCECKEQRDEPASAGEVRREGGNSGDTHPEDVRNPGPRHSAGLNEKGGEVDGRATLPRYLEGLTLTELEPHPTIEVEANDTYLTFGDALYPGQGHRTRFLLF